MRTLRIIFITLLVVLILGLGATGVYAYQQYQIYDDLLAYQHVLEAYPEPMLGQPVQWTNPQRSARHPSLEQVQSYGEKPLYQYFYDGIQFISYSSSWDIEGLKDIAEELFKNQHGEEIYRVSSVELYDGESDEYSGYHQIKQESFDISINLHEVLPYPLSLPLSSGLSVIVLTGADEKTTVQDMARTLSHEYGHHFTNYHFGLIGSPEDQDSQYYKLRKVPNIDILTDRSKGWDYYMDNHMWYLAELAAEDYVYFMGSDTVRNTEVFYDAKQKVRLYGRSPDTFSRYDYFYKPCINVDPHENTVMPMPSQVDDLAAYYFSMIGDTPPVYTILDEPLHLNLQMKKDGSKRYTITWDTPWNDQDVLYTLIAYNEDNTLCCGIKTIEGDERARAYIGKYRYDGTRYYYTYNDGLLSLDFLRFRVSVLLPDGTVLVSEALDLDLK